MTPRARVRPAAKTDLRRDFRHLADRNVDSAIRFLASAREAFDFLARTPLSGRERLFRDPRLRGVRFFPIRGFENWLIFYRPLERGVEVLRVLHGARDLERLLGKWKP